MKKLLLLVAAFTLSVAGVFAQGTWIPQATGFPNVSTGVFNVSVVDASTVWISSYDGSGAAQNYRNYSRTVNGGALWTAGVIPAPVGHAWSQIFGLDDQTAWAVMYNAVAGWGGGIWKTTNGGTSWTQQGAGLIYNTNGVSFPNLVHFWDANNGFAQGDPVANVFELYTTTDGGATWVPVPSANIPAPIAVDEYGIVNHYQVMGDTIWFDTNKGRVFRSVDRGLNWTVSVTGLTIPSGGAFDIVFWSATEGLARHFNGTTGVQNIRRTVDGGDNWTATTAIGNMMGADIRYVPGTVSRLISTGANINFVIGSSYSDDGGLTWTDIETGAQRTALGIFDINTMWAGGFTTSPTSDGIFKFQSSNSVPCGSTAISTGITSAVDSTICFNDTLFLSVAGAVSPDVGANFGMGIILSVTDISGSTDPLGQPGVLGGTNVISPAPLLVTLQLINDGTQFPAGSYYFTTVVFGNATGTPGPGGITDLTLDPACTYTGTSLLITFHPPGFPSCLVGLDDIIENGLSVNAFQSNSSTLNLNIVSPKQNQVDVQIYDLTGRLVASQKVNVSLGENTHIIDINGISSGTYVIRVSDESTVSSLKFVRY